MSKSRQSEEPGTLVRFWALDHLSAAEVLWPPSSWPTLVYSSEGVLKVVSEDRITMLPPNRAMWIPAGSTHRATSRGPCKIRSLYFHPGFVSFGAEQPLEVRPLFRELIKAVCLVGPLLSARERDAHLAHLLVGELQMAPTLSTQLNLPASGMARQASLLFLDSPIALSSVELLADAVGASKRTLERRFQEACGMSVGRWMQQAKLVSSLQLLDEDETLLSIALDAGYSNASAYVSAFRRHFGISPGALRKSREA